MTDQVHGLADALEAFDEPVDVLLLAGAEARGAGDAESGQVPGLDVGAGQVSAYAGGCRERRG
ncbi:hypothetical protein GCM10010269_82470 [Streptomyces humidus]|uniref:Uncharacterized protein n=1 Tax=Streptomyces humidus TaxID=52259 RepID=A0A918LDA2_9ACTN|nr:hypothetical protein GCM10010269_82470 [Streptomyces humidus]